MKHILLLFLFLSSFTVYAEQYLAPAKQGKEWGYIDPKGNWVIQPAFEEASAFSEGFAKVKHRGRFGFIDKKGIWIAKPIYEEARDFINGHAPVLKGAWGLIDTAGTEILKLEYSYVDYFFYGFARVKKELGWRMVGLNGKELSTVDFLRCEPFIEGLSRVQVKGKWGFIDTTGALVIKAEFEGAENFSNGLAWVRLDGKIGYIDKKGIYKIEPTFKVVKSFSDNQARVFIDGRWTFIDTTGKPVFALEKKVELVSIFTNGFAKILKRRVGYINTKGECVVEPKYVIAKDFNFGVAAVRKRGNFALIDSTGKFITEADFAELDVCNNGLIRARTKKGRWGFMDTKGNWIIKPELSGAGAFMDVDERNKKYKSKRFYMGFGSNPNDFR